MYRYLISISIYEFCEWRREPLLLCGIIFLLKVALKRFFMSYHVTIWAIKMLKMKWPNYNTNDTGVFGLVRFLLRISCMCPTRIQKQSYHYDSNLSFVCIGPIKSLLFASSDNPRHHRSNFKQKCNENTVQ